MKEGIQLKPKKKTIPYAERQRKERERRQKEQKRRIIFFSTIAVLLIAIVIALILRPDSSDKTTLAEFDYSSMPVLGDPNAPVKIVEYGDYQCPGCRNFSQTIKPDLVKDYVDTGKAAIYFADMIVLDGKGIEDSNRSALAAQSIFHQDKDSFWKFNNALYRDQGPERTGWATTDFLVNLAKSEGLPIDYDKLRSDIENKTYQQEVDDSLAKADKLNVRSTPSFFINGKLYNGDYSLDSFKQAIDSAAKGES
ncbi:DsbA family protein [Paenibacillus caui]|uniref:DsbA family protein n=1 Tax=Paenibacillus caui TaxID=2873927 RepID=UPI001F263B48|nr:thioredoxin domain-containing protein [Paenibacillus caui]